MGTLCNKNLGDMCEAMSGDSKCTETDCLMLAYVVNKLDKNVSKLSSNNHSTFLVCPKQHHPKINEIKLTNAIAQSSATRQSSCSGKRLAQGLKTHPLYDDSSSVTTVDPEQPSTTAAPHKNDIAIAFPMSFASPFNPYGLT